MLPYNSWVSRIAFGIFFLILIGYGYFEARGLLYGPQIDVPESIAPVHDSFVRIQGTAHHIASLAMNGKQVSVTEAGDFNEPYLLAPGTNRIVLDAKDKYGNATQRVIQIVYMPTESARRTPEATSTPTLSSDTSTTSAATTTPEHPLKPSGDATSTGALAH